MSMILCKTCSLTNSSLKKSSYFISSNVSRLGCTISKRFPKTSNSLELTLENFDFEILIELFGCRIMAELRFSIILYLTTASMAEYKYPVCLQRAVSLSKALLCFVDWAVCLRLLGVINILAEIVNKCAIFWHFCLYSSDFSY